MISPTELGLPPQFAQWRSMQARAVEAAERSEKRFIVQAAPTGFGKSLCYVANAMLAGRAAILTSTKGLQTQLMKDFSQIGLRDIRGMNAYPCMAANHYGLLARTNCAEGPCHFGAPCNLKESGCLYYDAYRASLASQLVVTNYSYWMHSYRYSLDGLGKFDLLVLDEAHDAPESISDFIGITLDTGELGWLLSDGRTPEPTEPQRVWREWARLQWEHCRTIKDVLTEQVAEAVRRGSSLPAGAIQRASRLKLLERRLEGLALMEGDWAIERRDTKTIRLEPVWPASYAEKTLFRGIPKVVLFSATVRPKTMELLGVRDYDFHEYPSNFPKGRRPVYYVPTIPVKFDSSDAELRVWVNRIDQFIRPRLDRKGIIHTTSYARRDVIVHNSEFRRSMLWHGTADATEIIERFKRAKPPAVLVSPSVTTGWDFPYDQCAYQIISKVPFPDFTTVLAKARDKADPDYSRYVAMQTMVQACGRGMRAEDDRCECVIVDDNAEWFIRRYGHFAPNWWIEAYQPLRTLPAPLEVT